MPAPLLAPIVTTNSTRACRRVLLVDDNRDAAESLQALLEMDGHTVALAFNGHSAIDQAASMHPEIIVLDIGLPDMTGYEVARLLKAGQREPAPLLVALTGYGREQDIKNLREAGFDHHFLKPADPSALMEMVAQCPRSSSLAQGG